METKNLRKLRREIKKRLQINSVLAHAKKHEDADDINVAISPSPKGLRTEVIGSYEIPRWFYTQVRTKISATQKLSTLGLLIWYACKIGYTGHKKRTPMNVDALVQEWKTVVTGLAVAHDKDEADHYEAAIEKCLVPILSAPIKQVREFYPKLLAALKNDPKVPFLVWRAYEIWVDQVISKAADEDIKVLKTDLAKEITEMVEQDVKDQIPEALMRALQWRNAETLAKVKDAVVETKKKGGKVRLRGRESCLFMEVGGTEDEPKACVQI